MTYIGDLQPTDVGVILKFSKYHGHPSTSPTFGSGSNDDS